MNAFISFHSLLPVESILHPLNNRAQRFNSSNYSLVWSSCKPVFIFAVFKFAISKTEKILRIHVAHERPVVAHKLTPACKARLW